MPVTIPIMDPPLVKYVGIFDYTRLYKSVIAWSDNRLYKTKELNYTSKDGGTGKEVEHKFSCEKKVDEFIKWTIDVELHGWDLKPIEIKKDEELLKKVTGKMEITIKVSITFDWQDKWGKTYLMTKLRDFYINKIIWRRLLITQFDPLHYEAYNLQTLCKDVLEMETRTTAF